MLTCEEVRELLTYHEDSGLFYWNHRPRKWFDSDRLWKAWNTRHSGNLAGSKTANGYWGLKINHRSFQAHRVAWLYVYGDWPNNEIDHINQIKTDNRIRNLRDVSNSENAKNKGSMKSNSSGVSGVDFVDWKKYGKPRWRARISADGRSRHIGYFDSKEEAVKARNQAKIEHGFHSNHA